MGWEGREGGAEKMDGGTRNCARGAPYPAKDGGSHSVEVWSE